MRALKSKWAWLAVSPLLAVGAVLLLLPTPVGQATLRWSLQAAATAYLDGTLRIADLEGSPYATLRLTGVELLDRHEATVASARSVEVSHRLLALLRGTLHLRNVDIDGLELDWPKLAATLPKSEPTPASPTSDPMPVIVDRATLDAPRLVLSQNEVLTDVRLSATATVGPEGIAAAISHLSARRAGLPIRAEGRVELAQATLEALSLAVRVGDVTLDLRRGDVRRHPVSVEGELRWPAGALSALLGTSDLRGRGDLRLRCAGDFDHLTLRTDGELGGGRIQLDAEGPRLPLRAKLIARRLDPSRVHHAAPPSRLDVTLTATIGEMGPLPKGRLALSLRGTTRPWPSAPVIAIRRARLTAATDGRTVVPVLDLLTSVGRVQARGRLQPIARNPTLDDARVLVEGVRLDRLAPDAVGGTVSATVTASGPLTKPTVHVELSSDRLRAGAVRVGGIDARLSARPDDRGVQVEWSRVRWSSPASVWTSTRGFARIEDRRVRTSEIGLASDRGRIRLRADLDPKAPFGATSSASIALEALSLDALRGLHPNLIARPRGRLDGRVIVDGRAGRVELDLNLDRARWSKAWPQTTARVTGALTKAEAQLDAVLIGRRWGRARASARYLAPADWRDPQAWLAAGWSPLRDLELKFGVDLARTPFTKSVAGTAQGEVRIHDGGRQLRARIDGRSVAVDGLPEVSRARLEASSDDQGLSAALQADVEGRRALDARAQVAASVVALTTRPLTSISGAFNARVDRFPLALLGLRPFADDSRASASPVDGVLTVDAQGRHDPRRGPRLTADVRLREVHLTPRAPPVTATVIANIGRSVATASASLTAPDLGHHRVWLRTRTPRTFDAAGLTTGIERLDLDSTNVSLAAVAPLASIDDLAGRVDIHVAAGRRLRDLSATVTGRGVSLHRALRPFDADVRLTQSSTEATVRATVELGGHRLLAARVASPTTVAASLRPGFDWARLPIRGVVEGRGYPLTRAWTEPPQRRAFAGRMSLKADISGTATQPIVALKTNLDELRIGKTRFDRFEATHRQGSGARSTRVRIAQRGGGRVTAEVNAPDDRPLAVAVDARRFRLGFLATVAEIAQAGAGFDGELDGHLEVKGAGEAATYDGQLVASQLRIALPGAPPIQDGRVTVGLDGQRAKVDVDARSGPGRIEADVSAALDPNAASVVDGQFRIDDVQIAGGGQIVSLDLRGEIQGRRSEDGLDAEVVLRGGLVRLPDRSSRNLHPINQRADVVYQRSRWDSVLSKTSRPAPSSPVSVRLRSAKPIRVRGEPIDAVVNLDVTARPHRQGVALRGDVRVEQGTVTLFGRRYTVERAQVLLGGQRPPQPRVDVLLSYEFNACTFFISTSGSVSNPKLKLSAEPDIYDDKRLLGFMFGASPDEENPDKTPEQQGIDAAAGLLLGQLQGQLKKNLPIDTLAVDLGDGTASGQANVSLGKWVTDRLFIAYTYRHGAAQTENTSEGLLRYRFVGPWLVELVFGDRGNGAADLLWTKRW